MLAAYRLVAFEQATIPLLHQETLLFRLGRIREISALIVDVLHLHLYECILSG